MYSRPHLLIAILALTSLQPCHAEHDIAYVAEHLPEAAMDNRYATIPVWAGMLQRSDERTLTVQGAFASTQVSTLSLDGPLLSAGFRRSLGNRWQVGAFAFYDRLAFDSGRELRPLETPFAPRIPIEQRSAAVFTGLDGMTEDTGAGVYAAWNGETRLLGQHRWVSGVLVQRVELRDYRFDYTVLDGPQAGTSGSIDFDATYDFATPFVGFELPRDVGRWTIAVHALAALPLPRQGVSGHITGPGFDLTGDTAEAGAGKHFGDLSVTLGLTFTYRPARLSIDLGTLVSQQLLEPVIHKGIDRNLMLSFFWAD